LVIDDLAQQDRFRQLPFVEGRPHSRFYAGTPLTSDSDINLGCLFVLDPRPREGLTDGEKNTLGTVAAMVMNYLQVSRQAVEGHRASRLSHGLRLFVDGNSSFADDIYTSRSNCSSGSWTSQESSSSRRSRSRIPQNSGPETCSARAESGDASLRDGNERALSSSHDEELDTGMSTNAVSPSPSLRQHDSSSLIPSNTDDRLFSRAANLLRQSLSLNGAGGVIFLKTSDDSPDGATDSHRNPIDSNIPAPVLALSTTDDALPYHAACTTSCPAANLDKVFLHQLVLRYPQGRLWSFNRDGSLSTSDDEQSTRTPRKHKNKLRASETSKLNIYFPDACQIMFVPLWNATTLRWFAGCFCWTPQPTRVFSRAVDLSSIFGFASSIMIEHSRVESVIANRQKEDFISSISHELRSPLHGVLAAAEFLIDTRLDHFQESLLEAINACGRTLLDTMNQVLDFSKIMSLERQTRRSKDRGDPVRSKATDETRAHMDLFVSTDVAILTEDVVESVCLGHSHMRRSSAPTDHPSGVSQNSHSKSAKEDNEFGSTPVVDIVVDISNNDWRYQVQPGSLRRLIMNLLGNSLKYTKEGIISVSIEATQRSKECYRREGLEDMVTLTISDTGRGISSEYLRTRLYTPFAQEDTLSVGTGLGLSIVRGIVRTLNGSINIQSRVDEGTTVKVSFPLERPMGGESPPSTPRVEKLEQNTNSAPSRLRRMDLTRTRAAIWRIDLLSLAENQFWSSVARYITDWYGIQLVPWSADEYFDILFADENDISEVNMQHFPTALRNLILFCNAPSSSVDTENNWSHFAESVALLSRPCGPRKLATGILNCLDPKPATPTLRPLTLTQKFVVPERPRPLGSSPLVEGSKESSSGYLESPATESLATPTLASGSSDVSDAIYSPKHDDSVPCSNVEMSLHPTPRNTVSGTHATSLSLPSSALDASSESQRKPRVLLVDDNDINIRLLETFMKKRKALVLDTAENGRAAVDFFEQTSQGYDLIFMDISMPIMNGFEATSAIRAIEKERDCCVRAKIIAFTGLSSLHDESRAKDSGVDLFLTKPVSFKEVSRLVDEWETEHST
jgi:signal transduction histidine kinase/CheY-like chemotaxis protein